MVVKAVISQKADQVCGLSPSPRGIKNMSGTHACGTQNPNRDKRRRSNYKVLSSLPLSVSLVSTHCPRAKKEIIQSPIPQFLDEKSKNSCFSKALRVILMVCLEDPPPRPTSNNGLTTTSLLQKELQL